MSGSSGVSDPVLHILLALADRPRHGYAIVSEIESRTEGAVTIGSGTLYTALKRLRRDGHIEEVPDPDPREDGRERRTYALTAAGRELLDEEARRLRALVDHALAKRVMRVRGPA